MRLIDRLRSLSDEEWLRLLQAEPPLIDGKRLPSLAPFSVQKRFNASDSLEANLRAGLAFYKFVRARAHLKPTSRVLDFGCGWGRVLRFFLRDVHPEGLFGVDVDSFALETVFQHYPYCSFRRVERRGFAPFDDEVFDLVYAVSVFSHLPEDMHLLWLSEIHRILKPGGMLVATTLSPSSTLAAAAKFRSEKAQDAPWKAAVAQSFDATNQAKVEQGTFVFAANPNADYGMTIIPKPYVERVWSDRFALHEYVDDPGVFGQAIIVASKRTA